MTQTIDRYLNPQSGCFINHFNINDETYLDEVEASLACARLYELAHVDFVKTYDLKHLQFIHHHMLQDLYPWAGQLRKINIFKGTCSFAHCGVLESAAAHIFKQLRQENYLSGLDMRTLADRLGHYLGEINVLHPFRDGNGRTQREFINHLLLKNGYIIHWSRVQRPKMTQASIEAYKGDSSLMATIIYNNLEELISS